MISIQRFRSALTKKRSEELREVFLEREELTKGIIDVLKDENWIILSKLYLGFNLMQAVGKFQACHFPILELLDLKGNQIQSLQALSRTFFPNLKHLNLKNNKLISISDLRCMKAPELTKLVLCFYVLKIDKNPIKNINAVFGELDICQLTELIIEYSNNKVLENDKSGIVKLNSKLQLLFFKSLLRIRQDSCDKMMRKRFPGVHL